MEWDNFDEKCRILGEKGEQFVYDTLVKKYPKEQFLILDAHYLCEMDWFVIDKNKEEVVEVYEVKTTTKDKNTFSAGSHLQLATFLLQQHKMKAGSSFIPCFLYVLRANNSYWKDGTLNVLSQEIYPLNELEIDFEGCKWNVNTRQNGKLVY